MRDPSKRGYREYMGSSQNSRRNLLPLSIGCRNMIYNQKGPIVLRLAHLELHRVCKDYIQGLGFPKIGAPFLDVPIIRIMIFWGLVWGSPYLGKTLFCKRKYSDPCILYTPKY